MVAFALHLIYNALYFINNALHFNLRKFMRKIIAVINQKGGVGKTATATHLAYCLSELYITLLIDLDPSRNATKPFQNASFSLTIKDILENKNFDTDFAIYQTDFENLHIIPSHISLAVLQSHLSSRTHKEKILIKQLDKISSITPEFIIIDCPPMLSEFSIMATYAADFILIPTTYEIDALEGIADLFDIMREVKEDQKYDYRILRNKYDKRTTTANEFIENQLLPFEYKLMKSIIRQDSCINNAKIEQKILFNSYSNSMATHDYRRLANEIKEILHA